MADFGAVLKPASRWDRLVLGVGAPLSCSFEPTAEGSNESRLMCEPFPLEANPDVGTPMEGKLL